MHQFGDSCLCCTGRCNTLVMFITFKVRAAKLYRHRDQFVVIDDVDALYADRSGVRLLKCLCQTEIEWAEPQPPGNVATVSKILEITG